MSVIGIRSNPNYSCPIQQTELMLLNCGVLNNGIISPTPNAIHHLLLGGGERRGGRPRHPTWVGGRSVGSCNDQQRRVPSYAEGIPRRLGVATNSVSPLAQNRSQVEGCEQPRRIGLGTIVATTNKSELNYLLQIQICQPKTSETLHSSCARRVSSLLLSDVTAGLPTIQSQVA